MYGLSKEFYGMHPLGKIFDIRQTKGPFTQAISMSDIARRRDLDPPKKLAVAISGDGKFSIQIAPRSV